MKNKNWLIAAPVVILCFVVIFSIASKKVQKRNAEIDQIHQAAESVIGDYLKGQRIKTVLFNSLPIFHDRDRGMIGCRALWVDENGEGKMTGFGVLLRREKTVWKTAIVDIIENPPMPKETNPGALDSLFKPAKKGR